MSISRQHLHELIDHIADERLPEITDQLTRFYDEELSDSELHEIELAKQRIAQGE